MIPSLRALTLAAALLTAGCMLDVEANVPDLEITQRDVPFEGVPLLLGLAETQVSQTYRIDPAKLSMAKQFYSRMEALEVTIVVTNGPTDLEFVRGVALTMHGRTDDVTGARTSTEMLRFQHEGGPLGTALTIKNDVPVDVTGPWLANDTSFTLDMSGWLPTYDWTADVTVRFKGKVRYKP